jgi:hypothetical protein
VKSNNLHRAIASLVASAAIHPSANDCCWDLTTRAFVITLKWEMIEEV